MFGFLSLRPLVVNKHYFFFLLRYIFYLLFCTCYYICFWGGSVHVPTNRILFVERHEELKELIHDRDVWHKSAKLVKALTDVSNGFAYLLKYTCSYKNINVLVTIGKKVTCFVSTF